MARPDKYDGGSKLVAFRLPLRHLEEAKKGIRQFLEWFTSKPASITEKGWLVAPGQVYDVEKAQSFVERLVPVVEEINVAEVKKKAKKLKLPKKLVEKLKELDPNIVVPAMDHKKDFKKGGNIGPFIDPYAKLIIQGEVNLIATEEEGAFKWLCGCKETDKLFKRGPHCKESILNHLKQ